MKRHIPYLLLVAILLIGCKKEGNYKMATSSRSASYHLVGQELAELFELETEMTFETINAQTLGSDTNIHLLAAQKVDFALAQGDTKIKGSSIADFKNNHHIKTVLPLYPEVLFIIYPDSIQSDNLADLVIGRKVGLGPQGGGTASFMKKLFAHFGIYDNDYEAVYTPYDQNKVSEEITISCALTGYNNQRIFDMLVGQKHQLFSLGNPELAFKGSSVDGFCLVHGPARPFILPKHTYMNRPNEPVLTVAVDAMLFTHEDVDKYDVYKLTESIFNNKQYLGSRNLLLAGLKEKFNLNDLTYPLHEGARMYFERDKPNFIERYSKLIGSALIAIVTGIPMIFAWYNKRKKERIDTFYQAAMEKEQQLLEANTLEEILVIKESVYTLRNEAFELLIDERLEANPSFTILTDLLQEVGRQVEAKELAFRQTNE